MDLQTMHDELSYENCLLLHEFLRDQQGHCWHLAPYVTIKMVHASFDGALRVLAL